MNKYIQQNIYALKSYASKLRIYSLVSNQFRKETNDRKEISKKFHLIMKRFNGEMNEFIKENNLPVGSVFFEIKKERPNGEFKNLCGGIKENMGFWGDIEYYIAFEDGVIDKNIPCKDKDGNFVDCSELCK